jgi:hypothetical protein
MYISAPSDHKAEYIRAYARIRVPARVYVHVLVYVCVHVWVWVWVWVWVYLYAQIKWRCLNLPTARAHTKKGTRHQCACLCYGCASLITQVEVLFSSPSSQRTSVCIQLIHLQLTICRALPTLLVVGTTLITTSIDNKKQMSAQAKRVGMDKGWRTDPYCCERIRRQNKTQASTISANDVPIAKAIAIATAEIEQHMQSRR